MATKKEQEEREARLLFEHLGVKEWDSNHERPDFIFDYEGKCIGLEHTKWLANEKMSDINSWRAIEHRIIEELSKSDLPPRLLIYSVSSHKEGKKTYKKIAEEIIDGYRYMIEKGIPHIYRGEYDDLKFEIVTYLSYYPNEILRHFSLSEITGGGINYANINGLKRTINNKGNRLVQYKCLPQNDKIQEYWLFVYIPCFEECLTDVNKCKCSFSNSPYDRIYMLNDRYKCDTSTIQRLK